jgi:hypothetical protein
LFYSPRSREGVRPLKKKQFVLIPTFYELYN